MPGPWLRQIFDAEDLGGYRYTAFGREYPPDGLTPVPHPPVASGVTMAELPFRWQGRWYDSTTKLYDFRARAWSPELGIFLQPDEFGYLTPTGTLWSWPGQNAIRWRDPTGHVWNLLLSRFTPANPTSAFGVFVGVLGGSGLPSVKLSESGPVFEFEDNAIQTALARSTTYGHVIVYSKVGTAKIASTRPHELAHVKQHVALGELYYPAHLLAAGYELLTGVNPLETGPSSTPPCPF